MREHCWIGDNKDAGLWHLRVESKKTMRRNPLDLMGDKNCHDANVISEVNPKKRRGRHEDMS